MSANDLSRGMLPITVVVALLVFGATGAYSLGRYMTVYEADRSDMSKRMTALEKKVDRLAKLVSAKHR